MASHLLTQDTARQLLEVEELVLSRWRGIECRELTRAADGKAISRAIALSPSGSLVACRDPAQPARPWHVRAAKPVTRDEALELCPAITLLGDAGSTLEAVSIPIGDVACCSTSRLLPLGYLALLGSCDSDAGSNTVCQLVKQELDGAETFGVIVRSTCDIAQDDLIVIRAFGSQGLEIAPGLTFVDAMPAVTGSDRLRWAGSCLHGVGVFATQAFVPGSVVEICPTLHLDEQGIEALRDYVFSFQDPSFERPDVRLVSLGLGAAYNHGGRSANADFIYDFDLDVLTVIAVRNIAVGDEILIDYGEGYWLRRGVDPLPPDHLELECDTPPHK